MSNAQNVQWCTSSSYRSTNTQVLIIEKRRYCSLRCVLVVHLFFLVVTIWFKNSKESFFFEYFWPKFFFLILKIVTTMQIFSRFFNWALCETYTGFYDIGPYALSIFDTWICVCELWNFNPNSTDSHRCDLFTVWTLLTAH